MKKLLIPALLLCITPLTQSMYYTDTAKAWDSWVHVNRRFSVWVDEYLQRRYPTQNTSLVAQIMRLGHEMQKKTRVLSIANKEAIRIIRKRVACYYNLN